MWNGLQTLQKQELLRFEIQKQYAKVKDELEAIDYKKTMAKYQLDDMNNQITYLNKISYSKSNEIAYLKIGVQELEGYVNEPEAPVSF